MKKIMILMFLMFILIPSVLSYTLLRPTQINMDWSNHNLTINNVTTEYLCLNNDICITEWSDSSTFNNLDYTMNSTGDIIGVNTGNIQKRIFDTCNSDEAIVVVNEDGTVSCTNIIDVINTSNYYIIKVDSSNVINPPWVNSSDQSNLNVNHSNSTDYWDQLDTPSDIPNSIIQDKVNESIYYIIKVNSSNILNPIWIESSDEGNLNVNSSDYWDELDTPSDIPDSIIQGKVNISASYILKVFWTNVLNRPTDLSNFTNSPGYITNATANFTVDTNETTRMNNIASFSCGGTDKVSSFTALSLPVCTTDNEGVTSIITGAGITGGPITTSGTIYINTTYTSERYVNRSDWTTHDDYPVGCLPNSYVTTIGDTLTCVNVVNDTDTTYTAGLQLDLTGTVFSHNDSSSVINSNNGARTYIQNITFDEVGHVLSIATATETVVDTWNTTEQIQAAVNITEFYNILVNWSNILDPLVNGSDNIYINIINGIISQDVNTLTEKIHNESLNSTEGDATYLRLDASNDPVTGNLDVNAELTAERMAVGTTIDATRTTLFYENKTGIMRVTAENPNAGAAPVVGVIYEVKNDAGHWGAIGMTGTGSTLEGGSLANTYQNYNEGYGDFIFTNDGNVSYVWYADPTDSHDFSALNNRIMELYANGQLELTGSLNMSDSPIYVDGITLKKLDVKNAQISGPAYGIYMTGPSGQNLPHFILQSGGSSQASVMLRSMMIVNEIAGFHNTTDATDCIAYMSEIGEELKIDCNTTTTGADLIVSDDMQVVGDVWIKDDSGEWHFMSKELNTLDSLMASTTQGNIMFDHDDTLFRIYNSNGKPLVINLDGVNYFENTSLSIALVNGTNTTPRSNYLTFQVSGSDAVLTNDAAYPSGITHSDTARIVIGDTGNVYMHLEMPSATKQFIYKSYEQATNSYEKYISGFSIDADSSRINFTSGEYWTVLNEFDSENILDSITDGFFIVESDETFTQCEDLSCITEYNDGGAIAANAYFNVIWAVLPDSDNTSRLVAIPQNEPSSTYISATTAEQDRFGTLTFTINHPELTRHKLALARTIVKNNGDTFELFGNGLYYKTVIGLTPQGASAGGTNDHSLLNNLDFINSGHTGFASQPDLESVNTTAESKHTPGDCPAGEFVQNTTTSGVECKTPEDTTYDAGLQLELTGTTFSHNDSSAVADSDNSGRTYIQDLTFDTVGHVLTVATATETVVDTNETTRMDNIASFSCGGTDKVSSFSGVSLPVCTTDEEGVTSVASGDGMDFTTITSTGTVTMGTPSTITDSSTNSASGTTHTHLIDESSTGQRGIVQLEDSTSSTSTTTAATPNSVKSAYDLANSKHTPGDCPAGEFVQNTTTGGVECKTPEGGTYDAGLQLELIGTTFSHNDSSAVTDSDNSGRTYIQDLTFDTVGHVLTVATATETVVDTNETTRMDNIADFSCIGTNKVSSFGSDSTPSCTTDEKGVTVVDSGDGMDFTKITNVGNVTLGTPSTITDSSTNSVSSTSHEHLIDEASTSQRGIVQLEDSTSSTSTTTAATPNSVKSAYDLANSKHTPGDCPAGEFVQNTTTSGVECKAVSGSGTVTSITFEDGLTGGTITSSGTATLNTTYTSARYVNRSDWTTHDNYPSACTGNEVVQGIGDTLACYAVPQGTVTSVTGAAPITSTGGATPEIALTLNKDLVAGDGLTGGEDNVLPGNDADTTITLGTPTTLTSTTTNSVSGTTHEHEIDESGFSIGASQVTAGTFGAGSYVIADDLTIQTIKMETDSTNHQITDDATCVIITGDTATLKIC